MYQGFNDDDCGVRKELALLTSFQKIIYEWCDIVAVKGKIEGLYAMCLLVENKIILTKHCEHV